MRVKVGRKWINALDAELAPSSVRIHVSAICNLEKVKSQYFIRNKSLFKIYYYIKEIGLKEWLEDYYVPVKGNEIYEIYNRIYIVLRYLGKFLFHILQFSHQNIYWYFDLVFYRIILNYYLYISYLFFLI